MRAHSFGTTNGHVGPAQSISAAATNIKLISALALSRVKSAKNLECHADLDPSRGYKLAVSPTRGNDERAATPQLFAASQPLELGAANVTITALKRGFAWDGSASRVAIAVAAAGVLTPLLTLPLGWQEQAVFATALILIAAVLNRTLRTTTVTLVLMAMSVFSTLRYGYWRTTQTWDGITSAGHFQQSDTIFVLLLLAAEFYAFTMLILGYFQTLHPLGRQPVALPLIP
jgi:hypothetical protein